MKESKIVLKNVNVLDGTLDMKLQEKVNVEIVGEKIAKIGNFEPEKGSKIIDLTGKFVCPGMINLHSHLPSSGKVSKKKLGDKSKLVKFVSTNPLGRILGGILVKSAAKASLYSGVTTVRAVGGVSTFDSELRDKINSGKILGPRLLVCNTAIGVKGGHMDGTVASAVLNKEAAVKRVHDLKDENVDLVKLMITGGVLDGKEPGHPAPLKMSKELVEAIVKEAHKLNLKTCAHVESPEGMKIAIEAGVDSIEHGSSFDEKLIPSMKKNNQYMVVTLSPALPFFKLAPEIHGYGEIAKVNSEIVFDGIVSAADLCLKNNIPVGLGTDAGSTLVTHYNFYKEFKAFCKYLKVSRSYALHTGTLVNAQIAGIDKITGSVEVGKSADLIVLDNNPLDHLEALRYPKMVMMRGHLIKNPKVKHYKEVDDLVDQIFE